MVKLHGLELQKNDAKNYSAGQISLGIRWANGQVWGGFGYVTVWTELTIAIAA